MIYIYIIWCIYNVWPLLYARCHCYILLHIAMFADISYNISYNISCYTSYYICFYIYISYFYTYIQYTMHYIYIYTYRSYHALTCVCQVQCSCQGLGNNCLGSETLLRCPQAAGWTWVSWPRSASWMVWTDPYWDDMKSISSIWIYPRNIHMVISNWKYRCLYKG